MDVFTKIEHNYQNLKNDTQYTIYDISGRTMYLEKISSPVISEINKFIFVCDSGDVESLEKLKTWHDLVQRQKRGTPFDAVIVFNKSDLKKQGLGAVDPKNVEKTFGYRVFQTSVLDSNQVRAVFNFFNN